MKALFSRYKKLHLWLLANLALLSAFLLARRSRGAMNALTEGFTNPLRRMLGRLCECVPFSVSEGLYVLAAMGFLAFLVLGVRAVVRSRHRSGTVYALVLGLGNAVLTVYVLFCLLWGANYYADSFTDKSGIDVEPVAVDDLERVTRQFAALVNEYAGDVPRAADGAFAGDRAEILAYAPKIYENLYEEFPFLEMTDVPPKAMRFSRVMSAMGFTGFYFPFTGECNVNVDFPAATLPTTVAHELSHRRGIASEQECNFLAVLASLRCGDAAYRYAGALSGYIYLANALYSADTERWRAVRENEQHYGAEARERYGNEAVDAMNERILDMDPAAWGDMKELEKAILGQLSIALVDGDTTDPEAAKLVQMHRRWIGLQWGAEPERDIYLGLVRGYLADPRFVSYYDEPCGKGAAAFLVAAVEGALGE